MHRIDWAGLPVASLVERWTGRANPSYSVWTRHGPRAEFWRRPYPVRPRYARIRAAVLGASGFWDVFARGQIRDIGALRRRAPRVPSRLWLAARDHFGSEWMVSSSPGPDYGSDPGLREEAVTRYLGPAPA